MRGALQDVGAKSIEWSADRRRISAKIGFNFWSFGERLSAGIADDGKVQVHSVCVWPLQIIDWGKNAENCGKFLEAVAIRLMAT